MKEINKMTDGEILQQMVNNRDNEINRLQTALDDANERLARSVELPCRVGDVIYVIHKNKIVELIVEHIEIRRYPNANYISVFTYYYWKGHPNIYGIEDLNKTWFTDKNKALEVMKND